MENNQSNKDGVKVWKDGNSSCCGNGCGSNGCGCGSSCGCGGCGYGHKHKHWKLFLLIAFIAVFCFGFKIGELKGLVMRTSGFYMMNGYGNYQGNWGPGMMLRINGDNTPTVPTDVPNNK